jgi:TatD DNase family protein
MFIDTHCHLDAAEFGNSQADIVRDAEAAGVGRMVVPSVACSNFEAVRKLCEQHPSCAPAYGIHPMYTDDATPNDLEKLREYLQQHRPVAIGEIGLDFFIPHYNQTRQEHFFVEQLKLAREFDLPVLLHIRRAQDTILKHLRHFYGKGGPTSTGSGQASTGLRTGIAHAFNGSRQQADEFIKLGFKLGFGGAMTYPRATRLRELAATLPLDSIVLETDAPDIPPVFLEKGLPNGQARFPHPNPPPGGEGAIESLREKRINEPKYLPRIAQTLAELRGVSLDEVALATTQNALAVLPKLKSLGIPAHNQRLCWRILPA